jgi:eukaryotic-like serine/threonine-protein kinase
MGEVYRARDTKLNRDVALKVLPNVFTADAERVARFKREAQLLALLNHPNIAAIYGFEESSLGVGTDLDALVLELVEGPTLADQIAQGPIAVDEALPIARQIAEALESAHEQGIVHRDLKPANIKLRDDGAIKVLDFGLAKLAEPTAGSGTPVSLSQSPTITSPALATRGGSILGTAAYMSPEQARGQPVDRRCDVWAFGCVLYEMLTGRRAFEGDSVGEVIGAIFKSEPEWGRLPAETPDGIRRLLRRCLQKDRKRRLQSVGDARLEIDEAKAEPAARPIGAISVSRRHSWLPWIVVAALAPLALAQALWPRRTPAAPAREVRFEVATPTTTDPISLAVSPDGSKIVFVAMSDGRPRLWLRSLDAVSARPLAGTDDGFNPFWSPDSRSVAFFASGRLNRIDLDTGLVSPLATAPNPLGGTWSGNTILFAPNYSGPLFKMAATGGDLVPATRIEARQASHSAPRFLPDGRRFLYFVTGSEEARSVYVGDIAGEPATRLVNADAPAAYTSDHVLFIRQGTLFAQPFDSASLELRGSPIAVAEQLLIDGVSSLAALSASPSGAIVYRSGPPGERQLMWFDRSGREIGKVGDSDRAVPSLSMSADGRRLCVSRGVNGNPDIWMLDLTRGVLSRLTFDPATEPVAVWSPDGNRVALNSNRTGVYDLYMKSVTDTEPESLLLATPQNKAPVDWSPDRRFLLFRSPGKTTGFDLWAPRMDGDRKPFPVVQTDFEERDGQFSPDGKWVAYQSNESGRMEIYVQPFSGGRRELISAGGGAQVRWRHDGKELFYIALDGRLMAVPIRLNPGSIEAGVPVPLFTTNVGGAVQAGNLQQYAVAPDGQRFLMSAITDVRTPAVTVILNWKPTVKER